MSLTAAALLMLATPAQAVEGLEWKWEEGQSRQYYTQSQVVPHEWRFIRSEINTDVRIVELATNLVTTCTMTAVEAKANVLSCTIDDVAFGARAEEADAGTGKAVQVLDDWEKRLADATILVHLTNDGRVRKVILKGIPDTWVRSQEQEEVMRQFLARNMSMLDLQLPKKGNDKGTPWLQQSLAVVSFPTDAGTTGNMEIFTGVAKVDKNKAYLRQEGKGTLAPANYVQKATGDDQLANLFKTSFESTGSFDLEKGELLSRTVIQHGDPTASSITNSGTVGVPYDFNGKLFLITDTRPAPKLGENVELSD